MGERSMRARCAVGRTAAGLVAGLGVAVLLAGPAGAATTASAQAGEGVWRNGEASATADTFNLNIKQGNANIGFTYGRSLANYRDITGMGEARALDLGVLPTLFGGEQCDGSAPTMNPETFPPNTRVDSTDPKAGVSRRAEAFQPGLGTRPAGASAGFQDATASKQPAGRGVTESARADMYVIAIIGGKSESTAELKGKVRTARAITTADELRVFGGLFTFKKPRWEALAKSGAETATQGSFTFESATVLGNPRDPVQAMKDLAGFEKGLEQLLKPLGVELNLPRVEAADGRVKVTPMEFLIHDMPWGAKAIAPFLGDIQPLKEALTKQLLDEDCKNASTILLLDVILGILAGSGSVEITAGGTEAFTADTDFSAPPLEPLPLDTTPPAPPTTAAPVAPVEVLPMDDFSDLGFDDLALDDLGLDEGFDDLGIDDGLGELTSTVENTAGEDDTEEVAAMPASSGSRFEDSGAGAAAVAVGVVGLLGAIGLSFGERIMSRRTSRRIP